MSKSNSSITTTQEVEGTIIEGPSIQLKQAEEWSFEEVCQFFGQNYTTVWSWYKKRDDTGFPEPVRGKGKSHDPFYFNRVEIEGWWFMWRYTRRKRYGTWQAC